ncbi:DUF6352 family protein [Gemmobacter nectariphilus]|uniref:DUF6352 family protein n=1 Tax=Gemmobacter nectariphilus TaxID=220343 RepID=UPI00040C54B2|nr:DUF6352 family protein [Gemmobacter nectariphilus]
MREFWVASGHHLTRRRADGWLAVTPELLTAWLARPELAPPEDACAGERALHARLLADPFAPVTAAQIAAIADPDGRENWDLFLTLRDTLAREGSVEGGYAALIRQGIPTAPVLLDQLAQLILRNALDGVDDVQTLRAAENLFRPQHGFLRDGNLHLVDLELAQDIETRQHHNPLGAMFDGGLEALDVLGDHNAWTWWSRSDAHTMVQNFGGDPAARLGLARAIEAFVRHLHRIAVTVQPVSREDHADLGWFVGLTREGTEIGNALWNGRAPQGRLVGLFTLDFPPGAPVLSHMRDRPTWLMLGTGADLTLRMKPQNLIGGLPLGGPT